LDIGYWVLGIKQPNKIPSWEGRGWVSYQH